MTDHGIEDEPDSEPECPDPSGHDHLARKLHATTDAQVWTEEFMRVYGDVVGDAPGTAPDSDVESMMLGWFANAIETGRMFGRDGWIDHMRESELYEVWGRCLADKGDLTATVPIMAWIVTDDQAKARQAFLDLHQNRKQVTISNIVKRSYGTTHSLVIV